MKNLIPYGRLNEAKDDGDIHRVFVRFGKLGLVKQEGYGRDTFHAPPAPRGFYAMPKRFQEFFLIGSIDKTQGKYLGYPKEIDWQTATDDEKKIYNERRDKAFRAARHEFEVDPHVELWHHLDVPNNEVIDRHNSWVKTTFKTWRKAVKKESLSLRSQSLAPWGEDTEGKYNYQPGGINSVRKRAGAYSMDHFEVFFDTKVF